MYQIRVFTQKGIDCFLDGLQRIRTGDINELKFEKLNQTPYSRAFYKTIKIKKISFRNRFQFGAYLQELFSSCSREELLSNKGLWTWLSFFFFSEISPINSKGTRKIKENAIYVFNPDNYRKYYRHIVMASWDLFFLHRDFSRLFLYSPLHENSDVLEQFASRQNVITNKNLIKAAYTLYWDKKKEKPKRNSSNRDVPGNIRRLVSFVNQIELTYDLNAMSGEKILSILPPEFSGWQS